MEKSHTKETAEALLRELPSVLGAFVREDVNGHPREVHVLIGPGPEPRHLARDIRGLLEERLAVPVDQRVISIAQLSDRPNELPPEDPGWPAPGIDSPEATPGSTTAAPERSVPAASADARRNGTVGPGEHEPQGPGRAARLAFGGVESATRVGRTEVRVRVVWRGREFEGVGTGIEGGHGRIRAAATAALRAATEACEARMRLELEAASIVTALGREYALVSALALSPLVGRRPLALAGAHPLDVGAETAAALAALQASNRVLGLVLRG